MRLRHIWSPALKGYSLKERFSRTYEEMSWVVAGWVPRRLRYFVTLREIARATTDSPNIPATPLDEILRNLDTPASQR